MKGVLNMSVVCVGDCDVFVMTVDLPSETLAMGLTDGEDANTAWFVLAGQFQASDPLFMGSRHCLSVGFLPSSIEMYDHARHIHSLSVLKFVFIYMIMYRF